MLGVTSLTQVFSSYFCGLMITYFNPKTISIAGVSTQGIAFSSLVLVTGIKQKNLYEFACYLVAVLLGIGNAALLTASYTYISTIYANAINIMSGVFEVFSGLGGIIGPLSSYIIRSYRDENKAFHNQMSIIDMTFQRTNFALIFSIVALVSFLIAIIASIKLVKITGPNREVTDSISQSSSNVFIGKRPRAATLTLPKSETQPGAFETTMKILKYGTIRVVFGCLVFGCGAMYFMESIYGNYLHEKWNFSSAEVDLLWLNLGVSYAVLSILVGAIADMGGANRTKIQWMMTLGMCFSSLSLILGGMGIEMFRELGFSKHFIIHLAGFGIQAGSVLAVVPTYRSVSNRSCKFEL